MSFGGFPNDPGAQPPGAPSSTVSLPAGSHAVAPGVAQDNGVARQQHSLVIVNGGNITAGEVDLQVSLDGVNWASASAVGGIGPIQLAGTSTGAVNGETWDFPARYVRASITVAVTGSTITVTVTSA